MEALAFTLLIGAQFLAAIVSITTREFIYHDPSAAACSQVLTAK
jgi:hypothetical protein